MGVFLHFGQEQRKMDCHSGTLILEKPVGLHRISVPHNYPALPPGNILFPDAIPPVGTKLATEISNDTWNLGPAGELNKMEKPVKRILLFYFGMLC